MRTGRAEIDGTTHHVVLHDDHAEVLDGAPWLGGNGTGRTVAREAITLAAPVEPANIICVGRNYAAHVKEMGFELPKVPSLFMKPQGTLLGPDRDVVLPPAELSDDVEHEAELVVVIGRRVRGVSPQDAMSAVYGFTAANDVSARDLQRTDTDVVRAKGFDTFCPIGPWVETDLDLESGVRVQCRVNGELRQDGSTPDLIFDIPFLVSYLSQFTTLLPGDVILTGSPGGTGPLRPGDRVEIDVEGLGTLRHGVIR